MRGVSRRGIVERIKHAGSLFVSEQPRKREATGCHLAASVNWFFRDSENAAKATTLLRGSFRCEKSTGMHLRRMQSLLLLLLLVMLIVL